MQGYSLSPFTHSYIKQYFRPRNISYLSLPLSCSNSIKVQLAVHSICFLNFVWGVEESICQLCTSHYPMSGLRRGKGGHTCFKFVIEAAFTCRTNQWDVLVYLCSPVHQYLPAVLTPDILVNSLGKYTWSHWGARKGERCFLAYARSDVRIQFTAEVKDICLLLSSAHQRNHLALVAHVVRRPLSGSLTWKIRHRLVRC